MYIRVFYVLNIFQNSFYVHEYLLFRICIFKYTYIYLQMYRYYILSNRQLLAKLIIRETKSLYNNNCYRS